MPHYPDLSPYGYLYSGGLGVLSVGWLARRKPYPRGVTPPGFAERLFQLCRAPVHVTAGYHACELCPTWSAPLDAVRDGVRARLGNGEVHVLGAEGRWYAAPTLVYHYVVDHAYCPPEAFVLAVLALPGEPAAIDARMRRWHAEHDLW